MYAEHRMNIGLFNFIIGMKAGILGAQNLDFRSRPMCNCTCLPLSVHRTALLKSAKDFQNVEQKEGKGEDTE